MIGLWLLGIISAGGSVVVVGRVESDEMSLWGLSCACEGVAIMNAKPMQSQFRLPRLEEDQAAVVMRRYSVHSIVV